VFLIAVVLSAVSPPHRWVPFGGSANRDEEYLDRESVRRVGDKVTLWTRRDLVLGQGSVWKELEFNCLMRTETIVAYIRDDGGAISHNLARPHRKASPILAKSVEETIFNLVCRSSNAGECARSAIARANYDAVSRSQLVAHALFSRTISFMDIIKR
jgi:hypothetical protein